MTVRSAFEKLDDVWYAADDREACLGASNVEPGAGAALGCIERLTDAVAIDNRDLTRSSGYVEPIEQPLNRSTHATHLDAKLKRLTNGSDPSQRSRCQPFWGIEFSRSM
jgi:hypothetical protein